MNNMQNNPTVSELLALAKARREAPIQDTQDTVPPVIAPIQATIAHTNPNQSIPSLAARVAALAKARQALALPKLQPAPITAYLDVPTAKQNAIASANTITVYDSHGRSKQIELNEEQLAFTQLVRAGKSCVLIGAAGTGKTTCTKAAIAAAIQANPTALLQGKHKHLSIDVPAVIPSAYTRRATNNIKRAMSSDIAQNTITIHKLLEYAPVYSEVMDDKTGRMRTTMRFEPSRTRTNPLDASIAIICLDEASMIGVDLFEKLEGALAHGCQIIFIGDIQQLPPTFGAAILGYKLLELPVIELKQVYRQALDSPIIALAHRILSGKPLPATEIESNWQHPGQLQFIFWPRKLTPLAAITNAAKTLCAAYDAGKYNPDEDVILCPFNKEKSNNGELLFSVVNINRYIANHIARANNLLTFEIIAGFNKQYYSIGDRVLYEKEDAIITSIEENPQYIGKPFQPPSYSLDYWGHDINNPNGTMANTDIDLDKLFEIRSGIEEEDDRTIQSSHKITIQFMDTGEFFTINSLTQLNNLCHAYAMTVHKAQGSEWQRVFLLLHYSHDVMIKRELLYTAVTRASKQLVIIGEKTTFQNGILKQAIKGNTLEEKAEYFKGTISAKIISTNSSKK